MRYTIDIDNDDLEMIIRSELSWHLENPNEATPVDALFLVLDYFTPPTAAED